MVMNKHPIKIMNHPKILLFQTEFDEHIWRLRLVSSFPQYEDICNFTTMTKEVIKPSLRNRNREATEKDRETPFLPFTHNEGSKLCGWTPLSTGDPREPRMPLTSDALICKNWYLHIYITLLIFFLKQLCQNYP